MQILVDGVVTGLSLAVIALAFAVVYIPTRVFHVAMGGVYAAVPFIGWACLQAHVTQPVAWIVAVFAGLALSITCEVANHWPLEKRRATGGVHLIASLGVYLIMTQALALIWGSDTRTLRAGADTPLAFGGITLTPTRLWGAATCVLALSAFALWLRRTRNGLQFRALAENPVEFALRGFDVRRARVLAFGVSGLLAAVAALVVVSDSGFDPGIGLPVVILGLVGLVVGGRLSFAGAVLGGVIVGILRAEAAWFLSARWEEALTLLLLAVFLFARPNGLLGRAARREAEA